MSKIIVLAMFLLFMTRQTPAAADAGKPSPPNDAIEMSPATPPLALEAFSITEAFTLQKNCPQDQFNRNDFHAPLAKSIEFGLRIPLPQRPPADSEYYFRYNCALDR